MKKFIKIFVTVLLVCILLIVSVISYKHMEVKRYIKENSSFDLIKVHNYKVFLVGENHTMAKSDKFKSEFFIYLNKKARVKNIIEEVGVCSGYLLNEYIQSGDEKYLEIYMSQVKGTMAYTKEKYEFYKYLCEYNSQMNADEKINIYGVDVEHDVESALKGLEVLIDDKKSVPKSLEKAIELLKKGHTKAAKYLKASYEENKEDCEEYFGENFLFFENGINNLFQIGGGDDMRDKVMMNNFLFIYSLRKDEKFFGQFGGEHVYQDYINSDYLSDEEVRFGILLNGKSSPVKNKVYSLLCIYENEDGYYPSGDFFDYSLFKRVKEDEFVELSGGDSPFYEKEYLFRDSRNGSVTCDYIQGIMILKNSEKTQTYSLKD